MKTHSERSFGLRLWSSVRRYARIAFFYVFRLLPIYWQSSVVVGAVSLGVSWHAYGFGQEEVVCIGLAMALFVAVYYGQSSEINAYQNTRKRLRWHTPVTDLLLILLSTITYLLTVRMGKDTRLFVPFIPQIVLHVIGFFAKRKISRFIDAFY